MEMKIEEEENLISCTPEFTDSTETPTLDLLPEKSKQLYEKEYMTFAEWCKVQNIETFSENVLLEYFLDKSKRYTASSLWTYYSMLKGTLAVKNNIDISRFSKLIAFLKSKSDNYKPKQSKVLTRDQIETFIRDAPDSVFLMTKVALIIAVAGGCRREELTMLTVDDFEDLNSALIVKLRDTKTKVRRIFTVVNNNEDFVGIYRKYAALRPKGTNHKRFFICYKEGKCSTQPVGKNTFGLIPAKVAEYLKLPDASSYTGHCFRRSSATLLTDSSGDVPNLRRQRRWRASTMTEGYVENPIKDILNMAKEINANETNTASTSSRTDKCENSNINIQRNQTSRDNLRNEASSSRMNQNINIDIQQNQCSIPDESLLPSIHINNCNDCKVDVHITFNKK